MKRFDSVVIDGMNVFKTAMATGRDLATSDGTLTGGIFHGLRTLSAIHSNFQFDSVVVLWDKGPYWRKALYPPYKGDRKRERTDEEIENFNFQFDTFRELLELAGICQIEAEGFEADDLAYSMKTELQGNTLFWSNDHDWLQLIDEKCSQYLHRVKQLVTHSNFQKETGFIDKEQLIMIKILSGDSDNIPGVPGIGAVKAEKFLNGDLKGLSLKKIEDFMMSEDYHTFRTLIDLSKCPSNPMDKARSWRSNSCMERFHSLCGELEMTSIPVPTWQIISERADASVEKQPLLKKLV